MTEHSQGLYSCHLLDGLFSFFPEGKKQWRYDRAPFHAFFDTQFKSEYSGLQGNIYFLNGFPCRFSPQLESGLDLIRSMGLLGSYSHDYSIKRIVLSRQRAEGRTFSRLRSKTK